MNPDGCGSCIGECGDSIEVQIRIRDNVIEDATFLSNGCGSTYAAATIATHLAIGRSMKDAFKITAIDVIDECGCLPEDHEHCAIIAVNALHEAVADAIRGAREPWKRLYR